MKLQIESPISRNITPTCEAYRERGASTSFTMAVIESPQAPLCHRAVVRARRRRRGFGGPLEINHATNVQAN